LRRAADSQIAEDSQLRCDESMLSAIPTSGGTKG
jgi:hypothetical protein